MRRLYAQSSAFVLPTRGEGYCLPVAEAMAMRLPVIVTNHSGLTAFATEDNAFLIPVDGSVVNPFGFIEPDVGALVGIMRRVVASPGERREKGLAGRQTQEVMTPERVVGVMTARVRALLGEAGSTTELT